MHYKSKQVLILFYVAILGILTYSAISSLKHSSLGGIIKEQLEKRDRLIEKRLDDAKKDVRKRLRQAGQAEGRE